MSSTSVSQLRQLWGAYLAASPGAEQKNAEQQLDVAIDRASVPVKLGGVFGLWVETFAAIGRNARRQWRDARDGVR